MSDVLLSARGLTKRFGGLAAVHDVTLDLWRERIHAVIGPNGAGKSTLTNLLSGDLPPTSGSVTLAGREVTGWSPERISRAGLGRSYYLARPVRAGLLPDGRAAVVWGSEWVNPRPDVPIVSVKLVGSPGPSDARPLLLGVTAVEKPRVEDYR